MSRTELADALAATGLNGLAQSVAAIRRGAQSDELADVCEAYADARAQANDYAGFAVCTDAAAALRESDGSVVTGEFRALRSSCIGGVACVEYEANDTARYVLAGLGHPEQPPELVRVWTSDPDEAGLDDWHDRA